jgi:hypothetical protein
MQWQRKLQTLTDVGLSGPDLYSSQENDESIRHQIPSDGAVKVRLAHITVAV